MLIEGRCHCGNIAFALDWPDDAPDIPARTCDCSFCTRHGGVWTSHPRAALRVHVDDARAVTAYRFGTGTATFQVCARCGVVPLVTSRIDDALFAVVNVNALDGVSPERFRRSPASFGAEDVEARLARRRRNWIADVRFEAG